MQVSDLQVQVAAAERLLSVERSSTADMREALSGLQCQLADVQEQLAISAKAVEVRRLSLRRFPICTVNCLAGNFSLHLTFPMGISRAARSRLVLDFGG